MGLFNIFKKKQLVPQRIWEEPQKSDDSVTKPKSRFLFMDYGGEVRERLLALANKEATIAEQWYQVLYSVLSRSSQFTLVPYDKTEFNWLTKIKAFQSSAGIFLFGIDQYEDGDQWFVHADEENYSTSIHIITGNPQKMCEEIAFAIQEAIGIRLSWEISDNTFLTFKLRAKDSTY